MKILVLSDSHCFNENLKRIITKYKNQIDIFIHCGDSSLPIHGPLLTSFNIVVKGNHDIDNFPHYIKYHNICITHGHLYNVYAGYDELIQLCKKLDCHICFHGHTHVPRAERREGYVLLNPGSVSIPKEGNPPTYGIWEGGSFCVKDFDGNIIKEINI